MTDEAGRYAFPGVMRGQYTMTASLPGFQTATVNNLTIGDTQLLQDFTLEVGMARAYSHPPLASCGAAGTSCGALSCIAQNRLGLPRLMVGFICREGKPNGAQSRIINHQSFSFLNKW